MIGSCYTLLSLAPRDAPRRCAQGVGCWVWSWEIRFLFLVFGFGFQDLGFGVKGEGFGVPGVGLGFRVPTGQLACVTLANCPAEFEGSVFRDCDLGFRAWGYVLGVRG